MNKWLFYGRQCVVCSLKIVSPVILHGVGSVCSIYLIFMGLNCKRNLSFKYLRLMLYAKIGALATLSFVRLSATSEGTEYSLSIGNLGLYDGIKKD